MGRRTDLYITFRRRACKQRRNLLIALPCCWLAVVCLASKLSGQVAAPANPLRTIAEVNGLTSKQARQRLPVAMEAQVLHWVEPSPELFLQQGARGIFCFLAKGAQIPAIHSGDLVRVAGVTETGGFSPILSIQQITLVGKGPMPAAPLRSLEEAWDSRIENTWGKIRGLVQTVAEDDPRPEFQSAAIRLKVSGSTVWARLYHADWKRLHDLAGAEVELTGIIGSLVNGRGQRTGVNVIVPAMSQLRLLGPAQPSWDKPVLAINSVMSHLSNTRVGDLVHVMGEVTLIENQTMIRIEDKTGAIEVKLAAPESAAAGSGVEVLGKIDVSDAGDYRLTEALLRLRPAQEKIRPVELSELWYDFAVNQGRLITTVVRIHDLERFSRKTVFVGKGISIPDLTCRVTLTGLDQLPGLAEEDVVRVVGAAQMTSSQDGADYFQISLRSPADIQILEKRPWTAGFPWAWAALCGAAAFSVALAWVKLLRREVGRRTEELAKSKTEAESASAVKSQFIANVSHEIRTPMNGILGMNRMLQETALSEEQRDMARTVQDCGELLLQLLNDVLDLSKIEAGQLAIEHIGFDLQAVVNRSIELAAGNATQRKLFLKLEVDGEVPAVVEGDPTRVSQILNNYLSNAIKFTARGGVIVHLRWADGRGRIQVQDSGAGLTPAQVARLFERFQQADSSTTRKHGGTGLGLAICKQLAQIMGGGVGAASEVGQGSTFWLELPLPLKKGKNEAPAQNPAAEDGQKLENLRILLAEDNAVNRRVVIGLLKKWGCQVAEATNGVEAIEKIHSAPFDAVLMDCQMPEMDGFEATREIRRQGVTTPIIALTANAIAGDRQRCLEAGMDEYLTKPLRPAQLFEVLLRFAGVPSA